MDYTEYVATVTMAVMGEEVTFKIPYLEEEYCEDDIYDMAAELIRDQIAPISYSIEPMASEVFYE